MLLKAMGFLIWGLIAIRLSVSFVTLSYRLVSNHRWHDKTRVDADKQNYAQWDTEATESPAGDLGVKLGEAYYGFGEYQHAVTAIDRSLQKGQIKHLDDAYVYLGRSQVALKDMDGAGTTFANLKAVPAMSPRVLRLWNLYADTIAQ
jgi:tetratricopeptide (TPR) repeat protein